MTRAPLLALLSSFLVSCAATSSHGDGSRVTKPGVRKRPNIVVIYADDHAQRAVGAYGSPFARTPHIDGLASRGLLFENSFVANAICGPARGTFLTGLHSLANGMVTNRSRLREGVPNIARMLRDAGYSTGVIGKWHIGGEPDGFDYWAFARGGYYNPELARAGGVQDTKGYTTEVITRDAIRWIDEACADGRPFFAWISHAATHRTWRPGPGYLGRYEQEHIEQPPTLFDDYAGRSRAAAQTQMRISRDLFPAYDLKLPVSGEGILDGRARTMLEGMTADQRRAWDAAYEPGNQAFAKANLTGKPLVEWKYQRYMKDYLRCVAAIDDSVGDVLAYLQRTGLDDETIVIYTSDQGFFLGEHGWYDKRWMYEPAFATPLIVRWPGVTPEGAVEERLVQNIDLAPTLAELAGAPRDRRMHGRSLVPLFAGEQREWRDAVYYHYHQRDTGRISHTVAPHDGVRTERYKLIHVYDDDEWELYDLLDDPDETTNLYGRPEYAELTESLRSRLLELRERFEDGPEAARAPQAAPGQNT